jgi:hypothetical protein
MSTLVREVRSNTPSMLRTPGTPRTPRTPRTSRTTRTPNP